MPSAAFEKCIPFILRWEGGFVDHPNDPGGRTNRGVTQKVYDQWRARQGKAAQDVKHIDEAEVHAIYESGYWLPPRCDVLLDPLDLVQFDTAVNMGVGRAVRMLQRCVGCEPDGDFGPNTKKAVEAADCANTVAAYCDAREAYYRRIATTNPKLAIFLRGWLNRLNALRREVGLPVAGPVPRGVDFGDTPSVAPVPDLEDDPRDL